MNRKGENGDTKTGQPDRLLRVLLGWTAATLVFTWLPLLRGIMDGDAYVWGKSYFGRAIGGSGAGGDYPYLVVEGIAGILLLYLGWRRARMPFHPLLLLWHGLLATTACHSAITDPNQYRFRGDTMGIDVSLAWVGPLFFGGFFLLSVVWVIQDFLHSPTRSVPPWAPTNTFWLAALVAVFPVQFALLRFHEETALTDRIGVLLVIAQCLLLGQIFRPRVGKHRLS